MKHPISCIFFVLALSCGAPERAPEGAAIPAGAKAPAVREPAVNANPVRGPEEVVAEFGRRMKNVSLLAPSNVLAEALRSNYSGLVTEALLARWVAAPQTAPGRETSSPWPERIETNPVSRQSDDRVSMDGVIVEMSSTGESGRTPVRIELVKEGEWWLIAAVERLEAEASLPSSSLSDDQRSAVAVIEEYYRAIAAKDFDRAYELWGDAGPPGQSREQFAAGFRETATVSVTTGAPFRVEPAAGSRYVDVPVVVNATTNSREQQRFEGVYTLRRSVVDGATAAQRKWHIERASLRRVGLPDRGA